MVVASKRNALLPGRGTLSLSAETEGLLQTIHAHNVGPKGIRNEHPQGEENLARSRDCKAFTGPGFWGVNLPWASQGVCPVGGVTQKGKSSGLRCGEEFRTGGGQLREHQY